MSEEKLEILTDWVQGAFNRTGNRYNVNKPIKECYDIAKDYLDAVEDVSVDKLATFLKKAEEHYNFNADIPSYRQIKDYWNAKSTSFSTERNLPEKVRSPEFQRLMDLAGEWISRGGRRDEITVSVIAGIGVIIGECQPSHIAGSLRHWQGITGRKIEVIK